LFLFSTTSRPPRSPLFPYTTLFRSLDPALVLDADRVRVGTVGVPRDAVLAHHLRDVAVGRAHDVVRRDAVLARHVVDGALVAALDRKSTRLNSSHVKISYAVFCLKK